MVSGIEVAKRAGGKRRYREEPDWAVLPLERLVERAIVETDFNNHFRLKPIQKKVKGKKWISPQFQRILDQSGKKFNEPFILEEDEDFPDI